MILGIYGASGLGTEFRELAMIVNKKESRWKEILYIDDTPEKIGKTLVGSRIISYEQFKELKDEKEVIIGIGEPTEKDKVFSKVESDGINIANLFYPDIVVGTGSTLGKGIVVQDTSGIPPMSKVGNNVLIQGKTAMGHDLIIEDNVVISSFVFVGGNTSIGRNTYVAPHSCIRNGLHIGKDCIIGMGSVVTKDVPDNAVVYGNPAKIMRMNDSKKVFSK